MNDTRPAECRDQPHQNFHSATPQLSNNENADLESIIRLDPPLNDANCKDVPSDQKGTMEHCPSHYRELAIWFILSLTLTLSNKAVLTKVYARLMW